MEAHSAVLFWPPNHLGQIIFKLIICTEESGPCPSPDLAEEILYIWAREGICFATAHMEAEAVRKPP